MAQKKLLFFLVNLKRILASPGGKENRICKKKIEENNPSAQKWTKNLAYTVWTL